MQNQVYLGKDGLINIINTGDQNYETITEMHKASGVLCDELHQQGKKAYVLVDLRKMGKPLSGASRATYEGLKIRKFDKIASFGGNRFIKSLINFIFAAVGIGAERWMKSFSTEKEARDWLLKKKS